MYFPIGSLITLKTELPNQHFPYFTLKHNDIGILIYVYNNKIMSLVVLHDKLVNIPTGLLTLL